VVTIDSRPARSPATQEYYAFGHASRFVRPGAVRIGSSETATLSSVAFRNPDGGRVLVVFNGGKEAQAFVVREGGRTAKASLPAGAAATFVW
jgi:glucosylceramidase